MNLSVSFPWSKGQQTFGRVFLLPRRYINLQGCCTYMLGISVKISKKAACPTLFLFRKNHRLRDTNRYSAAGNNAFLDASSGPINSERSTSICSSAKPSLNSVKIFSLFLFERGSPT